MAQIHPFVAHEKEAELRQICDLAMGHGLPVLRAIGDPKLVGEDRLVKIAFIRAVHEGFSRAQDLVVEQFLADPGPSEPAHARHRLALRNVMNSVAWQIIQEQLYIARRVFREREPPVIAPRELEALQRAGRSAQGDDFQKFALIADLTTFVQVSDLMLTDPLGDGLGFIEVKSGPANEEALKVVHANDEHDFERELHEFARKHGKKGIQQIGRILRQMRRMAHVNEVISTGNGTDPDSGYAVHVPDETLQLENYDTELSALLERAHKMGWAIDVIDDALFVGAYAGSSGRLGRAAFRVWLEAEGWKPGYPATNILQSMYAPLGLPVFSRKLEVEQIFDLLFGRSFILLGLHLDRFIASARKTGLPMRWSTRKEAARLSKRSMGLFVNNCVPIVDREGGPVAVGGGIVDRIFFHGVRPRSVIYLLDRSFRSV